LSRTHNYNYNGTILLSKKLKKFGHFLPTKFYTEIVLFANGKIVGQLNI